MSVLIKGMEMPKNCHNCELLTRIEVTYGAVYACQILNEVIENVMVRQIRCPLVEIPPHGRLIDADKAAKQGWTISRTYSASPTEMVYEAKTMTDEVLPTIIEAEEGE